MTLAEKIVYLREKRRMSQEELAKLLNVSRQTLAKWESGEKMPEIDKIVALSGIFAITADELIRDSVSINGEKIQRKKRHVSYGEAEDYIKAKFRSAYMIAIATFIIILSPGIMLILMSLPYVSSVAEPLAVALGMTALLLLVALSVGIYVYSYLVTGKYDYVTKERFTLDYSVTDMLDRTDAKISRAYVIRNTFATVLCIISMIPLIVTALILENNEMATALSLTATLFIAGIGVVMFITSGIKRSALAALKTSKSDEKRYSKKLIDMVDVAVFVVAVIVYLEYSFKSGKWNISWLIFVFAAIITQIISAAFSFVKRANGNEENGNDGEDDDE